MYVSLSGIIPVVVRDDVITSCRRVELTKHYWTASSSMFPVSHSLQWVRGELHCLVVQSGSGAVSDDLFIVDLSRDTVVSVIV